MKLKYILIIGMLFVLTACSSDDFYKIDNEMTFLNTQMVEDSMYLIFESEDNNYVNYYLEYSEQKISKTLKKGELYNVKYFISNNRGQSNRKISEIELVDSNIQEDKKDES